MFRLLTEADVKAVLTMDDLIETMTSALRRFSTGQVVQPVRPTIPIDDISFFATMPAYVRSGVRPGSDPHLPPDPEVRPGSDLHPTLSTVGAAAADSGVRPRSDPHPTLSTDSAALGAKLVTVFG